MAWFKFSVSKHTLSNWRNSWCPLILEPLFLTNEETKSREDKDQLKVFTFHKTKACLWSWYFSIDFAIFFFPGLYLYHMLISAVHFGVVTLMHIQTQKITACKTTVAQRIKASAWTFKNRTLFTALVKVCVIVISLWRINMKSVEKKWLLCTVFWHLYYVIKCGAYWT